jgi:hypothetical protein
MNPNWPSGGPAATTTVQLPRVTPVNRDFAPAGRALVAGLDTEQGAFNLAIIDAEADHFPWTDDLHRPRSLRSFERFWDHRFHCSEPKSDPPQIVAVGGVDHPALILWLASRGVTVRVLQGIDMAPFIREAADYGIPRPFRRAHAIAQCVATPLRACRDLSLIAITLQDLNFSLQQAEHTLLRLAAASNAILTP